MIERLIVIGLITDTNFIKAIKLVWNAMLIESSTARMIASWALQYYDTYGEAPNTNIESIFYKKVSEGVVDKEIAEEIEEDILPDLSEYYVNSGFNTEYAINEALAYLKSRQYKQLGEQLQTLIEDGKGDLSKRVEQARALQSEFRPINTEIDESLEVSDRKQLSPKLAKAFAESAEPVLHFPKQLGEFINHQLVPGAFISFLAPEKRGKTFILLEFVMRALRQNKRVAFFQAGDMNEAEQLKRMSVYLTKKSTKEKYCTEHYEPVRDCINNQLNKCESVVRECYFGIFEDLTIDEIKSLPMTDLITAYKENPEYKPCYNCKLYDKLKLGTVWLNYVPACDPTELHDAEKASSLFFRKHKKSRFKLSTHPNGTLSIETVLNKLHYWYEIDQFTPHLIVIDYADILVPSIHTEFRHQQNQIWKDLRRLSQTKLKTADGVGLLPLVISPTQADADSYTKSRLGLSNFSEDKRKYGHVTAMYGLNQDPHGREKSIGILRINEIILREGEYATDNEVTILQNLRQGRPYKYSYFSS